MARWRHALLGSLFAVAILEACGSADPVDEYDEREHVSEFDEADAKANAASDLSGQTFQDVGDTSQCTEDCSGHDAGWQWAQENDVQDSTDCSGNGSFAGGCEAYVEELESRVEEARDDAEAN